jgi:hypothetical protein
MDASWAPHVASVVETSYNIVSGSLDSLTANRPSFSLLNVPSQNAISICHAAASIFEAETLVVHVEGEFVIVGDLRGYVLDLPQVFIQFGLPAATKYNFLGAYVNQGNFSVHTTLHLLALKYRYPQSVYLLRGNHEFEDVNEIMGLFAEIRKKYHRPDLCVAFNHVFADLPLEIGLNDDVVHLHGGIGPQFVWLDGLKALSPPTAASTGSIVEVIA